MGIEEAIGFWILGELAIQASATVATVVGSIVVVGTVVGLQIGANMLLAKQPGQGGPTPEAAHVALHQSMMPRYFGYGRTRIINGYALYEGKDGVSYDVLAICQGPICGIVGYLLHEDRVVLDQDGYVFAVIDLNGNISADNNDGRYCGFATLDASNLQGFGFFSPAVLAAALDQLGVHPGGKSVKIETQLGIATETAFSDITTALPTEWDATHRGDGIASLALTCKAVPLDQLQKNYPNQKPEPSVIADLLPLWDFRDNATQNPTDRRTWTNYAAYNAGTSYASGNRVLYAGVTYISAINSNLGNTPGIPASFGKWVSAFSNPVLQIVDYLTNGDYGLGLDRALLIDPVTASLITEANLCDEIVATADGIGEPRYRSDGWSTFSTDPAEVLAPILAACDGWMIVDGDGYLSLKVGKYSAPTITLGDKHILGCSVQYGISDKDVVNELALTFCDPGNNYKTEPGQPWRNESDISSRGKVRSQPFDLSWVQSHAQGRRLTKRAMSRLLAQLRGKLICTLYGLIALGKRYLTVNFTGSPNMVGIVIEVQKIEVDFLAARVTIDWILVNPATIDAFDSATEEGTPPPNPDAINGGSLPVPDSLTGSVGGDAATGYYLNISITDPQRADLSYVFRYRVVDDGAGSPGPWTQQIFTAPIISGGLVNISLYPTTGNCFEVEAAFQGSGGSLGDFCASIFLLTEAVLLIDLTVDALPVWINPVRAGVATYYNASGILQTASTNAGRIDHDPTTLECLGFLVEATATYLIIYSGDLSDVSGWHNSQLTVTPSATTGPDGTSDAAKLVENSATNTHYVRQESAITISNGANYTFLISLKAAERGYAAVQGDIIGGKLGGVVTLNLSTGAIIDDAGLTVGVKELPSGWYRVAITATSTGTSATPGISIRQTSGSGLESYAGDGSSGIYACNPQLLAGSIAASYFETTSTALARAADAPTLIGDGDAAATVGPSILEYQDQATMTVQRISFAAGAFAFEQNAWNRKLAIYPPGTPSVYLTAHLPIGVPLVS